jgi:hypothetical protein
MATPQNPSGVQVQPNSTGQDIETVLVTQVNTGNTVGRQVMALGDPNAGANVATITAAGQLLTLDQPQAVELDVQLAILVQLRINNELMKEAFNLSADLVKLESQFIAAQPNQISGKAP